MHLIDRIFSIHSDESFEKTALEVFRFQYELNSIYRSFADSLGKANPKSLTEIPFLPIGFFKTHAVISGNQEDVELTFLSSGTTDSTRSIHLIHSASIYEKSFEASYRKFIGNPEEQVILGLLPNYIEQGNSSLVYMVDKLIHLSQSNLSGFMLNELESVKSIYSEAIYSGKKVVIFGVSYALLDLAEKGIDLSHALIIETGVRVLMHTITRFTVLFPISASSITLFSGISFAPRYAPSQVTIYSACASYKRSAML
jgi:hypothetical protein